MQVQFTTALDHDHICVEGIGQPPLCGCKVYTRVSDVFTRKDKHLALPATAGRLMSLLEILPKSSLGREQQDTRAHAQSRMRNSKKRRAMLYLLYPYIIV